MTEGKRPVPDGGYDGSDEEEEDKGPKKFRLVKIAHFYSASGEACAIEVDGTNKGIVYLTDEEFKWLKPRIDGVMDEH